MSVSKKGAEQSQRSRGGGARGAHDGPPLAQLAKFFFEVQFQGGTRGPAPPVGKGSWGVGKVLKHLPQPLPRHRIAIRPVAIKNDPRVELS